MTSNYEAFVAACYDMNSFEELLDGYPTYGNQNVSPDMEEWELSRDSIFSAMVDAARMRLDDLHTREVAEEMVRIIRDLGYAAETYEDAPDYGVEAPEFAVALENWEYSGPEDAPPSPDLYQIEGYEVLEKRVKSHANTAHILVPRKYVGARVKIVICDPVDD